MSAAPQTVTSLRCISMINQECKLSPQIVNVNSDEPVFYPFNIKTSKCGGSCNNINDPYAKICVKARQIESHEICNCKCRLDVSACNNKQRWNDDKCSCECKELIDKGVCDEGFIWNPSNCECECDKSCNSGKYLDYESCKCKKRLVDKLVERSSTERGSSEEYAENIDEVKIAEITSTENVCVCSYTICVILAEISLAISIGTGAYFTYFSYSRWYLKKMLLVLSLAHVLNGIGLKKQFNECNSIELINRKSQANRDKISNLLFLQ